MNKIFKSIVMVALMLVSVSAMGQTKYGRANVSPNHAGTGTVSASTSATSAGSSTQLDVNSSGGSSTIYLWATPSEGFIFLGWKIAGGSLISNSNTTYNSNYRFQYTLEYTSGEGGSSATKTEFQAVFVPIVKINGDEQKITNNTLSFTDAGDITSFESPGIYDDLNIQYTRNFKYNNGQENVQSTDWQPWFVPFKFNTGNAPQGVSFAKLAGAFTDLSGRLYVAYLKVNADKTTNKTIKANTPYLVKSETNSSVTFNATTLEALEATPVVIQSSDQKFTFNGTYATESGAGKSGETYYALKADEDGRTIFAKLENNSSVNAFRYIMTQSERTDKLYPDYTASSSSSAPVRVMVYDDQEDLADAIKAVKGRWIDAEGFYDLTGRKVQPGKVKGFFINGGKKYFSR